MDKRKFIGTILGVILFALMIAGITYAYMSWTSEKINYTVNSKCFDILYTKGTDITGTLMPSTSYTGGLNATVKMNISSSCDLRANGKIYLNTAASTSSNLYRTGLLNYHVVKGSTVLKTGNITESGEIEIDIGELAKSTSASTSYTVYVWVDYNLVENSDAFSSYSGSIRAEALQFE